MSAGVDVGRDHVGGLGEWNVCGIDHQIIRRRIGDIGVKVRANITPARRITLGVMGHGLRFRNTKTPRIILRPIISGCD